MDKFGNRLQKYRQSKRVSQEEFSDEIGMSRTAYAALEQGVTAKTFSKLPVIAKALGCRIDDLFPEMDDVQPEAAAPAQQMDDVQPETAQETVPDDDDFDFGTWED